MRIVLLDSFTANPGDLSWEPLEALGTCEFYPRSTAAETITRCAGAEIVITNKAPLTREIIQALPDLKYIGVTATGYNIVDIVAAKERGIIVSNVPGYSTPGVAQHVISLILELSNHVGHSSDSVREGRWASCPDFCYWDHPIFELSGRTLGIIGYGEIGAAVGKIATAFGMHILASKRTWKEAPPAGVEPAEIDEIFRRADIITLHCPLTDATKHLICEHSLSIMKPEVLLINTGRGPLIDETALANALNCGRIAGAGLDVLSAEPPTPNNPLLTAKNYLITPHVAWASRESRVRLIRSTAANLSAFLSGKPVNVVTP